MTHASGGSEVNPSGPVQKSSGDNVVRMCEEMMCVVYVSVTEWK